MSALDALTPSALSNQRLGTVFDGEMWKCFVPRISPPYMITTPDIVSKDLQKASGEQLRFVILASDGREWPHRQATSWQGTLLTSSVGQTLF